MNETKITGVCGFGKDYTEREIALFAGLGFAGHTEIMPAMELYRIAARVVFAKNRQGVWVECLRRACAAIDACKPYRHTPEFEVLINPSVSSEVAAGITAPIVHPNGTPAVSLVLELTNVVNFLEDVYKALKQAAPNGRDYSPTPGLMEKAVKQFQRRLKTVDDLKDELEVEIGLIEAQRGE